jgi:flagellar biosynthesis anti-sigma factor FlgM
MTMKIDGNRPTQEAEALKRSDAQAARKPALDRAADKGDRVDVSADAKQAQGLVADAVKAANALPDIRPEAVARGRARLESGELGADAGKLADAILNDLLK